MRCQTFYFLFFPCSADHERDWPLAGSFFGLATNTLNVRNNNSNNNNEVSSDHLPLDQLPTAMNDVLEVGVDPQNCSNGLESFEKNTVYDICFCNLYAFNRRDID